MHRHAAAVAAAAEVAERYRDETRWLLARETTTLLRSTGYPDAKEVISFITHLAAALRGRTVPRRDRRRGGGGGGGGGRRRRGAVVAASVVVVVGRGGGGGGGGSDGREADRGRGKGRAKEEEEVEEEETAATTGEREDDAEVEAEVAGKSLRENVSR